MTRRFDLSRDGAFVPSERSRPGQVRYDSAGRPVADSADQRLLFADELPEEPGLEDALVRYIAQVCTQMRGAARRAVPAVLAGGAWASAAAAQVSAATLCQAAPVCVLTAVGGSTLHYWQKSHRDKPAQTAPVAIAEPARPQPPLELADAAPPAPPPSQETVAAPVPDQPAEPPAAPAHALSVQEQLPLSAATADPGASADADLARPPLAGAAVQRAAVMEKVAAEDATAPEDAPAAAPRHAAPVHPHGARLAVRSAPVVHPAPTVVRMAPPVLAHLVQPRHLAPRVVMTRFDMPHWLTETHAAPRPPAVMSAPPHALAAPHEQPAAAADSDHDSDTLNVPAREEEPARPALAVVAHRDRFSPYGQPAYYPPSAYYPRAPYYPPASYYQPYGYPYGPYGYPYGRY